MLTNIRIALWSGFWGGLFVGVPLGAFVLYSFLVNWNLYPKPLVYEQSAPSGPAVVAPTQPAQLTGRALVNPKSPSENPFLPLSTEEIRKIYNEVIAYHDFLDYMKIFLPISLLLLITLGGTLGNHFVRANVFEAREKIAESMQKELSSKTDEAKVALEKAKVSYDSLTHRIDIKINHALIGVDYALANIFWRNKFPKFSVTYCDRALKRVAHILPFLEGDDLKRMEQHSIRLTGELAYYYAECFLTASSDRAEDGENAIRLARELYKRLDKLIEDPEKIVNIDNYVFTVSRARPISGDDKVTWVTTYKNHREALSALLARELNDGGKMLATYDKFLKELESRTNSVPKRGRR